MFFLYLLLWIKLLQQFLYGLYVWQLREYRFDRMREMVGRVYKNPLQAILATGVMAPITGPYPIITVKAVMVFLISIILCLTGAWYFYGGLTFLIITLLTTPLIIGVSIAIIWPFEFVLRQIIYYLASLKMQWYQKKYGLVTIGITGSFGKSTTKYFLNHVLSSTFNTLSTNESVNTPLGLSRAILTKLKPEHRFFIAEMGAYKPGEIRQMCQITKPSIGILTAIGSQHLALFGSKKALIAAKSELINSLPKNGLALISKKSPLKAQLNNPLIELQYYGDGKISPEILKNALFPAFLKENLEPALFLADKLRIDKAVLKKATQSLPLPPHTMIQQVGFGGALVIDDTFNANPEGVVATLKHAKTLPHKNLVVVMRCLIELGSASREAHQTIGKALIEAGAHVLVITPDYLPELVEGARTSTIFELLEKPKPIIDRLKQLVDKETVVLLEGKMNSQVVSFATKP